MTGSLRTQYPDKNPPFPAQESQHSGGTGASQRPHRARTLSHVATHTGTPQKRETNSHAVRRLSWREGNWACMGRALRRISRLHGFCRLVGTAAWTREVTRYALK
jgi:hypothetical protein